MRSLFLLTIFFSFHFQAISEETFFDDVHLFSESEALLELEESSRDEELLYEIDFSAYKDGDAKKLLKRLGFVFKMGASSMNPTIKNLVMLLFL